MRRVSQRDGASEPVQRGEFGGRLLSLCRSTPPRLQLITRPNGCPLRPTSFFSAERCVPRPRLRPALRKSANAIHEHKKFMMGTPLSSVLVPVEVGEFLMGTGPVKLMSRLTGPGKIEPQNLTGFPLPFFDSLTGPKFVIGPIHTYI